MIEKAVPLTFGDYVGQNKAKETLQTVLDSTQRQMEKLMGDRTPEEYKEASMFMPPSILIIGPPGYGKTRMAQIYASQMMELSKKYRWPLWAQNNNGMRNYGRDNWNGPGLPSEPYFFAAIEGKDLTDSQVLDHYFYYLQTQGVLFIDECQTIPKKLHEHFLRIMTEQKYQSEIGNRLMDHFGFSLIGATTHEGRLFRPFLERFKIVIMMESYKLEDFAKMIENYCHKLDYSITADAVELLVDRSRENPRVITQNLDMLFLLKDNGEITLQDALKATELRGIGLHGLMDRDIKILEILEEHGKVGKEVLTEMTDSVDINNYKLWERYLIHKGFIMPSRTGRMLTEKGQATLNELKM